MSFGFSIFNNFRSSFLKDFSEIVVLAIWLLSEYTVS